MFIGGAERVSLENIFGKKFCNVRFATLGIGVIRTYPAALHHDPLTIFVWSLSTLATLLTLVVLGRKRVR